MAAYRAVSRMMCGHPQDRDWKDPHAREQPPPGETSRNWGVLCAQALTGEPRAKDTSQEAVVLEEADVSVPGRHPHPEEQTDSLSAARQDMLTEPRFPRQSCTTALGLAVTPGRCPGWGVQVGEGKVKTCLEVLIPADTLAGL